MNDVDHGGATATGPCVVTDGDGDKVYMEWKCTGPLPTCPGIERFVGGTGKYNGLSGDNKFQGNFIGTTGAGWSDWRGAYKLPCLCSQPGLGWPQSGLNCGPEQRISLPTGPQ